jgi:pseudaminic acid synthase
MISIAGREIGRHTRPYVIAEMSGNHNQSLERALAIVDAAAASGADAIKLQTYTADTMTLDVDAPGFVIDDPASLWHRRRLYDLYHEAHTPWEWHESVMRRAAERGVHCFSTPFDETAVDFLESLGAPAYKIASFECTDLPLIRRVAATGKPVIISLGMATLGEIEDVVRTARSAGCKQLILLKCTSTYPATPQNSNVATIPHLREAFGCEVGLSDHTMGCGAAVAAVALGAVLVEKHFTTSRADGGVDSAFSLEPPEFAQLRVETERAWQSIGQVCYGVSKAEEHSLQFRRSLYVVRDVEAGETLTQANVRAIRPGYGLAPTHWDKVLGRRARHAIARGTPLAWDLLG